MTIPPTPIPILAFELLQPAMLGWLLAAALPLVIHLWSRRKHRETSWAAMEYLLRAMRNSRRRMSLEQWFLLFLRTLIVVLVVLAVADPVVQQSVLSSLVGTRTHRLLVIDGSFSMGYKPGDKSRFERAKEIAARIVEQSTRGDAFTLILMADPPRVVVGTPAFDPRDFLQELDHLEMTHGSADLPRTVAEVERVITQARREDSRLARHEVYFLTDLGRVGWGLQSLDPVSLATFHKRSRSLAELASLGVIYLGQPDAENLAVTSLTTPEPVALVGRNLEFRAVLKGFGRQSRSQQPIELVVDGRPLEHKLVDVPAGSEASAVFSCRFDTPGDHVIEARAPGDALDTDNHRFLVLPVRESISVLCVDGRPSGEPFAGATGYLAAALAPQRKEQPRPVRAQIAAESALAERDLARYDCIFLANVAQFTSSEAQVLRSYVAGGGNLVFFLGDRVLPERYNEEFWGDNPKTALLPARLGQVVEEPIARLDPLDYRHPIAQALRGPHESTLLVNPIRKHIRLSVPNSSNAHVVLAMEGGDPLVVERSFRRGRVIMVATSADLSWTPMPVGPSFVPLVQELLAFALAGQTQKRNVLVGEAIGSSTTAASGGSLVTIQTPGGRSESTRLQAEDDPSEASPGMDRSARNATAPPPGSAGAVWSFSDTTSSGIYSARFGSPISHREAYAVNFPPGESDLAPITPEELREEIWPEVPLLYSTDWQNLDHPAAMPLGRSNDLPRGLLLAVLILLIMETHLARRFGHHA